MKILRLDFQFVSPLQTAEGAKFWSGTKRAPKPIVFDPSDEAHMAFIESAANLRAFVFGLKGHTDHAKYLPVLAATNIPPFKPKGGVKIAANEKEAKEMKEAQDKEMADSDALDRKAAELVAALPSPASLAGFRVHPAEFEKDDDTNFHIDFVTAVSNLRARNYRIKEENKHQTKLVAGKIIPALSTTTSFVAGLIVLELYKVVQKKPLDAFRCGFGNLALPVFSFAEPERPIVKSSVVKGIVGLCFH